jgi:hypothetical protein
MKTILSTTLLVMALHLAAPTGSSAQYYDQGPRFRFGAEAGAGFWPREDLGLAITALPSFGIQFNDTLGVVAMTGLMMGGFTGRASPDLDDEFARFTGIGLFDVTLGAGFQVGFGGGVGWGDFGACLDGEQNCVVERDTRGAMHGRAAFVPGFRTVRGRMGFPLAFHYHAPFREGKPVHELLFTFGFQRY